MARMMIEATTVSTELNGLEKRFALTHSRGGNFGVSGGAVIGIIPVDIPRSAPSPANSLIYRSTSFMRTLNQFTTTEMLNEQLR